MEYRYLFGPVRSRRLGRSLGIDLVPGNICSFNCVYCECGTTTHITRKRAEYAHVIRIQQELDHYLRINRDIDYITLGGTGEPTLHSEIGTILEHLKKRHPEYKRAVLTNSTLLHDPAVRNDIKTAHIILPSLDAVSNEILQRINRPPPGITAEQIIDSLIELRREFTGKIWLEIFFIPDINTTEEELHLLRDAAVRINPDLIHINSLNRSGAEPWVQPLREDEKKTIQQFFMEKFQNTYIL
ncbi:MAG: Radical SAM domain protein [Methanomicrobiales archaeon 53_19]|uniref:radical SAM protein n=1 Tax=Methanocalculus sp. TaxID=2004547 RepID=UPI000747DE98|nr:radical SAM protein [Methanocalculus sp.]KUK69106.1 MAG: Radical SAM domain protein [Methanocalculus sp. 52_23]KUL03460.1 MAG: Radical SAM domain protein [Methanomicrobiales archaeon 53_19]HIJ07729.1 radical SAM protein [Methanocalculus sp.]